MSFFNSYKSHYLVGFLYGLGLSVLSDAQAEDKIIDLYIWAWDREVAQHDPELSLHQIREARAWGDGAAKARRLDVSIPVPPYPNDFRLL